jgi:hypothetical protein
MSRVLCGANSSNMKFYFNEADYGILPKEVKERLKIICVLYTSDVGGAITLEFSESHALRLVTIAPIDEIGAELKIKNIRDENRELFEKLEEFDEKLEGLRKKD